MIFLQKSIPQGQNNFLDGLAEAVADAAALFEGVLVVVLDPGGGGLGAGAGQAGGVEEAVKEGEIGKEVFLHHAFEVELEEGEADEAGAVAEEPEDAPVGDEAVEVLGDVEVFLEEAVGRGFEG